ncbi:MAG: penicillin-binding protein [Streptococcus salivarius]|nr:penicillin-binding protein [Streptococcus salivarius]
MNFEKIINYFRRLGQAIRTKFAGSGSKRGDKSFNERKATTDSKWNRKQGRKSPEDRMTLLDMGDVFLKTLKLLSDFFYVVIIVLTLFGAGIGLGYLGSQIESVPSIKDKTLLNQISEVSLVSSMSYSDSKKIADIDTDLLRTPIESDAISNNVKNAIIATEDENFKKHKGVVPKAVFRALVSSVLGVGSSSGGSTLTQQLIKQQVTGDAPTFKRKAAEIIYALQLERRVSIEEAAQGIFGVSAADLTVPQAAYLAGLPQSPIVYSPYTADGQLKNAEDLAYGLARQQDVLYNLYRGGYLDKSQYESYKSYDITKDFKAGEKSDAVSHDYLYYSVMSEAQDVMYDYLVKRDKVSSQDLKNDKTKESYRERALQELQTGGYSVKTTIDNAVYNAMQDAASQYGGLLDQGGNSGVEVGNVLMDNATGAILGFVGGRSYENNQNNHAFDTARSPGSSIKPIIAYGIAIDQGLMGSSSILSNYPTNFTGGTPILHDGDKGTAMMNLQEALNTSWNIPVFWTYQMLQRHDVDVEGYMTKMGYKIANYNIESLPLGGGIETTVAQQVNAYQMLSNGGVYEKGYMIDSITDRTGEVIYQHKSEGVQVFSRATASIMDNLLKEVVVKGATTQFHSELKNVNGAAASADWMGKTGTTDNFADAWLIVSTPGITLGGWAGYDNNTPTNSKTGYTYNAQYMARLTSAIYNANPGIFKTGDKFNIDSSAIKASVLKSTGLKPATVSVNGRNVSVSGEMVDTYWAKNGPGDTTYKFAIGGTDSDYQKAWSSILGGH